MYKLWLFLHMTGLSIGAGTSIYISAVAHFADRYLDQAEARTLMPGVNAAISSVGKVGMVLLLVSGIMMAHSTGLAGLNHTFWLKMLLVAVILAYIVVMEMLARKLRTTGEHSIALRMKQLGIFGPLLGIGTVLVAVLVFN